VITAAAYVHTEHGLVVALLTLHETQANEVVLETYPVIQPNE